MTTWFSPWKKNPISALEYNDLVNYKHDFWDHDTPSQPYVIIDDADQNKYRFQI